MSTKNDAPRAWRQGLTGYHGLVLIIACLGWIFDVFEGQLFTLFKTPAMAEVLGVSTTDPAVDRYSNYAFASFLVGGAVGGLFFGMLADRIGRRKSMVWSILTYSVFTGVHYFATTWWHIAILRFLVAVGVGGEWAIAAALVAEVFSGRARTAAGGIFHASSVVGIILATLLGMTSLVEVLADRLPMDVSPWRIAFLIGVLPAILIVWILASLKESERWQAAQAEVPPGAARRRGPLTELMTDARWRKRALIGFGLAAIGLSTYWGIIGWAPELAGTVLGPDATDADRRAAGSTAYLIMSIFGALLGQLAFPPITMWIGRRKAFAVYHVGALITVPIAYLAASSFWQTTALLTVMAFFTAGMHSGYAIYFPEMFPTRLRATGASFCFNVGRLGSAGLLLIRGEMRAFLGFRWAVALMSLLFVVGLLLLWIAPETKDEELPE
ncbi:MAG: MFS transporter [Pirellulales bacterium]|nr:MFS transporter [Pirellulales bacterium]